jgi:hypothetical protein
MVRWALSPTFAIVAIIGNVPECDVQAVVGIFVAHPWSKSANLAYRRLSRAVFRMSERR